MPRPLPPGGEARKPVPLRMSPLELQPVEAIAVAEHDGDKSATIRELIAEALAGRQRQAAAGPLARCANAAATAGLRAASGSAPPR